MEDSQNFLETPEIVRRFVFKAFARQNLTEAEMDARPEILKVHCFFQFFFTGLNSKIKSLDYSK